MREGLLGIGFRESPIAVALRVGATAPCTVGRSTYVHAEHADQVPAQAHRTPVPYITKVNLSTSNQMSYI